VVWNGLVYRDPRPSPVGGWPSYGKRRKRRRVEEVEEKIEAQQAEIEDKSEQLRKEQLELERFESGKRLKKAEQDAKARLLAQIAADVSAIEEMRRIHDELRTLLYLEELEYRNQRRRNQHRAVMMES